MRLICLIFSIFCVYTAAATTIYFNEDGTPDYNRINESMQEERMEWISVQDMLPPIGEFVMIYDPEMEWFSSEMPVLKQGILSRIEGDYYFSDGGDISSYKEFTHWMPLPPPPSFKDGND